LVATRTPTRLSTVTNTVEPVARIYLPWSMR
jgi:hypothetical protein